MEKAPQTEKEKTREEIEQLLEFRFNQSNTSKLTEYITGIRPDDPQMADRLIEDQKIIRGKYNLPPRDARSTSPSEYEHLLKNIAKKNGSSIRDKSERSRFFERHAFAGASYDKDGRNIFVGIDRNNLQYYIKGLGDLEHEIIHSEQDARYKGMPIELSEYEAYIAGLKVEVAKESPETIEDMIAFFIGGSVNTWYAQENEILKAKSEPEIQPVWKNPEYFLKNIDNIDQEDIDAYRKRITTLDNTSN
jgi:hypothetical protein